MTLGEQLASGGRTIRRRGARPCVLASFSLKFNPMAGKPGRSGGARVGAGAPPGSGGAREGAGRPPGVGDTTLSVARILTPGQKWQFAEYALQHAYEALDGLINLMRNAESENVRLRAMSGILDRSLGKAPAHIDATAPRHTEIVYRSAAQIRQELAARGVPPVLLDYVPPQSDDDNDEEERGA
jgi:hypothetical protein